MKGIILAAGLGSRMKDLSKYIPKPLFPLGNKRLIDYSIKTVKRLNLDPVVVGGYLSNKLEEYLNKKYNGIEFKKAGIKDNVLRTLLECEDFIKEEGFCWLCSDTVFTDFAKLERLARKHLKKRPSLSMLISRNHTYTPKITMKNGEVDKFEILEKGKKELSSPFFFFSSKKIFDLIKDPKVKKPIQELIDSGSDVLHTFYEGAHGANTPEEYFELHEKFVQGKSGSYTYDSKVNGTRIYNSILFESDVSSRDQVKKKIIFGDKYEYKLWSGS